MFVLEALLWLLLLPFRLVLGILSLGWLVVKVVLLGVFFLIVAPVLAVTIVAGLVLFAIFV
jgi:hypothetical protein